MNIRKEIIRITSEYFEDKIDYLKLSNTSKEYKSILNAICDQDIDTEEGRKDIKHENGTALGTFWATLCLDDMIRTRQFIRGIDKAIKDKKKKKPIHILYAGTGPFAALILPIILRYQKEDIKYTLLEVNQFTFQILQNIISKLGLKEFDIDLVNNDATKFQIDSKNEPDIIINETMQNALAKEQQVPIFLNLMRQVKLDTIFIPEKIELHLGLKKSGIPTEELQVKHFNKVEKVFEVSKESMFLQKQSENKSISKNAFPKKKSVIDSKKLKGFNQLVIITEIQVYKNEKIVLNESGLTTPLFIQEIPENLKGSIIIDTQYQIASEPKLEYKITLPHNV
jgi:predicted RNA methylase